MTKLRLRALVGCTTAEGPGRRAALWVQGCSIRCPGCFNPHMWEARGGREVEVEEVMNSILSGPTIEGVTFLGGEPFDQAAGLVEVARRVQAEGLSVMTFTGYWLEDLVSGDLDQAVELLGATDLLVDGPYDANLPDISRPWVGSRNQRFHHLTSRYVDLAGMHDTVPDRIEVRMSPAGDVFINGQAGPGVLPRIIRNLGLRPVPRTNL